MMIGKIIATGIVALVLGSEITGQSYTPNTYEVQIDDGKDSRVIKNKAQGYIQYKSLEFFNIGKDSRLIKYTYEDKPPLGQSDNDVLEMDLYQNENDKQSSKYLVLYGKDNWTYKFAKEHMENNNIDHAGILYLNNWTLIRAIMESDREKFAKAVSNKNYYENPQPFSDSDMSRKLDFIKRAASEDEAILNFQFNNTKCSVYLKKDHEHTFSGSVHYENESRQLDFGYKKNDGEILEVQVIFRDADNGGVWEFSKEDMNIFEEFAYFISGVKGKLNEKTNALESAYLKDRLIDNNYKATHKKAEELFVDINLAYTLWKKGQDIREIITNMLTGE